MKNECLICKRHYTQSGTCQEFMKNNCIMFEEEPRGKMIRTNVGIRMIADAETPIIKKDALIKFEDGYNRIVELRIIKINSIDLNNQICSVVAEYHENETPSFERKKWFTLVKE